MGHKAIWAPFFLPLAWCPHHQRAVCLPLAWCPHHQREISVVVGEDTNNGLAPCGCQGTICEDISRSHVLTFSRSHVLTIFTSGLYPTQVDIL